MEVLSFVILRTLCPFQVNVMCVLFFSIAVCLHTTYSLTISTAFVLWHAVMYRNFISETFLICGCPVLLSDLCIIESLKHKCFLEELLFWTIKYEFPQKMVTFLLNMLPDQDYKVFYLQTCSNSLMIMDNLSTIVLEPWVAIVAFIFIRLWK